MEVFPVNELDHVFSHNGLWGFWDETQAWYSYGYETEWAARLALQGYAEVELREANTPDPTSEAARFWRAFNQPWSNKELDAIPFVDSKEHDVQTREAPGE